MLKYKRPNNVHVVYYDEVSHAKKKDPDYKYLKSAMVNPLKPIRNTFYNDMTKLAHAIVRVEPTGTKATVERFHRPARIPGPWLNLVSGATIWVPAAVMVGLVGQIGPLGPTAAACWLAASWLLY